MFGDLTDRLDGIFKKIRGQGILTEENIKESLREVRRALLEADVNFKIVKKFINEVQKRAVGQEVLKALQPGQQVIKIVHEQLVSLMGSEAEQIRIHNNRLTKVMMVGLQGSGKTTTTAKLANMYRKKQKANPVLAACDIYRPAAIHQLQVLGKSLSMPVIADEDTKDVLSIAKETLAFAERNNHDLAIFDTAGRLHIDEKMMQEVKDLKDFVKPDYIFFVADAMTGQDAVNVAKQFNELLEFTGVVLTKMDGDARGGAALSIKAVTSKPIIYVGIGEKTSDIEEFHPDRMASRILGMGDVLSLIERAEAAMDEEKAEKMAKRLQKNQFTFNDFLDQLQQVKRMGPLDQILKMIPGLNSAALKDVKVDDNQLKQVEAIIYSMTTREREKPDIINGQRRLRIAKGSGTTVQKVNQLLKQYAQMKKMIRQMNNTNFLKRFKMPKGI